MSDMHAMTCEDCGATFSLSSETVECMRGEGFAMLCVDCGEDRLRQEDMRARANTTFVLDGIVRFNPDGSVTRGWYVYRHVPVYTADGSRMIGLRGEEQAGPFESSAEAWAAMRDLV